MNDTINELYLALLHTRDENGISIEKVADQIKDAFAPEEVEALIKQLTTK